MQNEMMLEVSGVKFEMFPSNNYGTFDGITLVTNGNPKDKEEYMAMELDEVEMGLFVDATVKGDLDFISHMFMLFDATK